MNVNKNITKKNKDLKITPYIISKGHSTTQTTYNIYVRVTNKMETDTVDKFEDYTNSIVIPPTQETLFKIKKFENLFKMVRKIKSICYNITELFS